MQKSSLLISLAILGFASSVSAQRFVVVDSSRNLYDLDVTTGVLTQFGTVTSNVGTSAGLAHDPATGTTYVTSSGNDSVYTLDIDTGTATLLGAYGPSVVMHGIEWDSSTGSLYGGSNGDLFSIDTTTGAAVQIGDTGLTSFLNLVHDTSTNTLYATNSGADSFYSIDRTTGVATLIGSLAPLSTNPNALAYDPVADVIYAIDNSQDILYTIDRATGAPTLIGPIVGSSNPLGLVYIPEGGAFTAYCFGDGTGAVCPCGNTGSTGRGCENGTASGGGLLTGSGSTSIAAANTVFHGSGLQPSQPGLYFQGDNAINNGDGLQFGDGLRCAGGNIRRLQVVTANLSGESSTSVNIALAGAVNAGDTKRYQLWYRNPLNSVCGTTFNLTNGLELTWAP